MITFHDVRNLIALPVCTAAGAPVAVVVLLLLVLCPATRPVQESIAFQDGGPHEEHLINKASEAVLKFLRQQNTQNQCCER